MICPYCNEQHETWNEAMIGEYEGIRLEYNGTFFKCTKSGVCFADTAANDIALKDAYRIKKGMLTSKMIQEIRMRYRERDLQAILGNEERKVYEFGGHHVQSKEYDIAIKTLDHMLQLSLHQ